MEDIAKNIKAIEKEKKEYLASKDVPPHDVPGTRISDEVPSVEEEINTEGKEHRENSSDENEEESENVAVDVIEISLDEEEINEWIIKLTELKVEKTPIELEVDEENSLKINYEESEDEKVEEEGEL